MMPNWQKNIKTNVEEQINKNINLRKVNFLFVIFFFLNSFYISNRILRMSERFYKKGFFPKIDINKPSLGSSPHNLSLRKPLHTLPKLQITQFSNSIGKYQFNKLVDKNRSKGLTQKNNNKRNISIISQEQIEKEISNIYTNPADDLKQKMVFVKLINSIDKPPHRYKTTLIGYPNGLMLYGGLGCQKKLSWAQFDPSKHQWKFPVEKTLPLIHNQANVPIYGHTMIRHNNYAYIYGGVHHDITNELTILDIKSKQITRGKRAPFRRKDHAATILSRFMVVHGGIQINQQVKNQIFYYCIALNKWQTFTCGKQLPYLHSHQIVIHHPTNIKKIRRWSDLTYASLYIFGGKDQNGIAQNRLYKLNIINETEIDISQIKSPNVPQPRFGHAMQNTGTGFLLIYGGKQNEQKTSQNQVEGVFSDVHLFNIEKQLWQKPELGCMLQPRYGMASTMHSNKMYIFGGCGVRKYADAGIIILKLNQIGQFLTLKQMDDDENDKENERRSKLNLIQYFK